MQKFGKKGVLLVNLGTPDAPTRSAVYRYLKQFLLDKRVIDTSWLSRNIVVRTLILPFRSGASAKLYKQLWTENGSPLKYYGELLAKGVQQELGEEYIVELAMRYQSPSIQSVLDSMLNQGIRELIVLPLFPHYASASTASVQEEVMRLLSKEQSIPKLSIIDSFYDYAPLLDVFEKNARELGVKNFDHVLFSYHGLPERQLSKVDKCNHCFQSPDCCSTISQQNQFCYSAQCHATTRALVQRLGLKEGEYTTCFQSRLGRAEWIKPYTIDVLKTLAGQGKKRLLAFSPAFVADCLETIVEITHEYNEEFQEMGGESVTLVPSLNDDPKWVRGVADLILAEG